MSNANTAERIIYGATILKILEAGVNTRYTRDHERKTTYEKCGHEEWVENRYQSVYRLEIKGSTKVEC